MEETQLRKRNRTIRKNTKQKTNVLFVKKIPPNTIPCGGFLSANAVIAKKETFVVGLCLVQRANGKNVVKIIFITALVKLIALKCESGKIGKNVVKMVFITALVKLFALSLQIRMNKS